MYIWFAFALVPGAFGELPAPVGGRAAKSRTKGAEPKALRGTDERLARHRLPLKRFGKVDFLHAWTLPVCAVRSARR